MTAVVDDLVAAAYVLGVSALEVRSHGDVRDQIRGQAGLGDFPVRQEQWRAVVEQVGQRNEAAARQHAGSGTVARCRECDSPIWWGETEAGRRMCLDPLARPMGNVIRLPQGKRMVLRVLGSGDLPVVGRPAYQVHFASCPGADQLRRARSRRERHRAADGSIARCQECGRVMDPWLAEAGYSTHPNCDSSDKGSER